MARNYASFQYRVFIINEIRTCTQLLKWCLCQYVYIEKQQIYGRFLMFIRREKERIRDKTTQINPASYLGGFRFQCSKMTFFTIYLCVRVSKSNFSTSFPFTEKIGQKFLCRTSILMNWLSLETQYLLLFLQLVFCLIQKSERILKTREEERIQKLSTRTSDRRTQFPENPFLFTIIFGAKLCVRILITAGLFLSLFL